MKPNTFERISKRQFTNVRELIDALELTISDCNQAAETIYISNVEDTVTLEAECLTDGSIVYNVAIE